MGLQTLPVETTQKTCSNDDIAVAVVVSTYPYHWV